MEEQFLSASAKPATAKKLVTFAQRVTAWTEQGKLLTLLALDVGRAACRVYGQDLVDAGILEVADDLFYFTIDEIRSGAFAHVRELVTFRRARRTEYLGFDLPLTWTANPTPIVVAARSGASASDSVRGVGCSEGVYEGRARLVARPGCRYHGARRGTGLQHDGPQLVRPLCPGRCRRGGYRWPDQPRCDRRPRVRAAVCDGDSGRDA